MPSHPDRVRAFADLPDWFQFGDAAGPLTVNEARAFVAARLEPLPWRPPHVNAAEQLARNVVTANVIEAEEFYTACDPGDETPWAV